MMAATIAAIFYLFPGTALFAQTTVPVVGEIVFKSGVIDLRENAQIQRAGTRGPARAFTPRDLSVGSIFITSDNEARKVSAIYKDRGKTVIETVQPRIEEVFETFTIPDQTIQFTKTNIKPSSIRPGVTVSQSNGSFASAQGGRNANQLPIGAPWIETDPRWMDKEIATINIDIPIMESEDEVSEQLKGAVSGEGEDGADDENADSDESKKNEVEKKAVEASSEVTGEVRLKGTLKIGMPILRAGAQMPEIKITWVKVWWYVGYPKIEFKPGYLHASVDAAQQLDCKLYGNIKLTAERKIPLFAFVAQPTSSTEFTIGVYVKVTVDGEIVFGFDVSEYADLNVWGTVDLVWPFIPTGISTGSDRHYFNSSVRPYISAEVEARAGLGVGASAEILGFDIFGAELGGGIYANAQGSLESKNSVGFNSDYGSYGSTSDWAYYIAFELGAFLQADMTFAIWDVNLLDYKWPFLKIETSGGGT